MRAVPVLSKHGISECHSVGVEEFLLSVKPGGLGRESNPETESAGQEIQSWLSCSARPLQNTDKLGMALCSGHVHWGEQRKW